MARPAAAGCPSICKISVAPLAATPALPGCLSADVLGQTCDCSVFVDLHDACSGAFASDVSLSCTPSSAASPCTAIPAMGSGVHVFRVQGNGEQSFEMTLTDANQTAYHLTFGASVSSYNGSPGCSFGRGPASAASVAALLGTAVLLGCRRRSVLLACGRGDRSARRGVLR